MQKRHITSAISQGFGKFASKEFPTWIQKIINSSYVGLMGLDMGEFHASSTYKSLNALFTRRLKVDRRFSLEAEDFISPCDSQITECGTITDDYALQIKGMRYKCADFIGDEFSQEEKSIIGVASVPSKGIRKGQVVDIEETTGPILESLEGAERMAGYSVSSAFISANSCIISFWGTLALLNSSLRASISLWLSIKTLVTTFSALSPSLGGLTFMFL